MNSNHITRGRVIARLSDAHLARLIDQEEAGIDRLLDALDALDALEALEALGTATDDEWPHGERWDFQS